MSNGIRDIPLLDRESIDGPNSFFKEMRSASPRMWARAADRWEPPGTENAEEMEFWWHSIFDLVDLDWATHPDHIVPINGG